MERETTKITLPASKAVVEMYTYLTTGEHRKVKRTVYKEMRLSVKDKKADVQDITGEFMMDSEDIALECLIKSITDKDDKEIKNVMEFVSGLRVEDGDVLYNKIEEITGGSVLGVEEKKD